MADEDREGKKTEGSGTVPAPAEEAPEETARLILRAAGVGQKEVPPQTPEEHLKRLEEDFRTMIDDVKKARGLADRSVERAEKVVQRVESFCQEKLPQLIVAAVDRAAEQGVRACLSPVRTEVQTLKSLLREVQWEVAKSFWWVLGLLVGCSFVAGVVGGSLVCYYLRSH